MRSTKSRTMSRTVSVALALAAVGAIALAAPSVRAKDEKKSEKSQKSETTNFSGAWKLDREASDMAGMRGGMGGRRGGMGGGMGGPPPGGEMGGPPPDGERRAGGPRGRMGRFLRIEQTPAYVTVADSAGATMREVALGDAPKGNDGEGVPVASGRWSGHKLEVVGSLPNGRMYSETWSLSDDGKTLTIVSKTEARDDRPAMEMKRVYRRVTA